MNGSGISLKDGRLYLGALVGLSVSTVIQAATPLEITAQDLRDGEWREYTSSNWGKSIAEAQPGSNRSVIDFSQRMHWDSLNERLWFWGSGHQEPAKIIRFDANSDTWTNINNVPSPIANNGHAYDEQGIDVQGRNLWKKQHSSDVFHRMNLDSGSWQTNVFTSPGAGSGVAQGMEVFPNFMGTTALLDYTSLFGLRFFDLEASGTPEMSNLRYSTGRDGNDDIVAGFNHQFIVYDPANRIMVLGGGKESNGHPANRIYKVAANHDLTELDNIPSALRIGQPIHRRRRRCGNTDAGRQWQAVCLPASGSLRTRPQCAVGSAVAAAGKQPAELEQRVAVVRQYPDSGVWRDRRQHLGG